jgi:hypothetical protein
LIRLDFNYQFQRLGCRIETVKAVSECKHQTATAAWSYGRDGSPNVEGAVGAGSRIVAVQRLADYVDPP